MENAPLNNIYRSECACLSAEKHSDFSTPDSADVSNRIEFPHNSTTEKSTKILIKNSAKSPNKIFSKKVLTNTQSCHIIISVVSDTTKQTSMCA